MVDELFSFSIKMTKT